MNGPLTTEGFRLSEETSAEVISVTAMVLIAPNLGFFHSFQVKSMSRASRGWPSDHFSPDLKVNFQVLLSALMPPLANEGTWVTRPDITWPCGVLYNIGAYSAYIIIAANVSFEALVISESGSSNRSSIQVPPLTGVPALVVGVVVVGVPPVLQALSSRSTTARAEKDILRKRGLGFLSIVSS